MTTINKTKRGDIFGLEYGRILNYCLLVYAQKKYFSCQGLLPRNLHFLEKKNNMSKTSKHASKNRKLTL